VIAYFDTSALVSVLIDEPATPAATRLWQAASRVVSALLFVSGDKALCGAARGSGLQVSQL